MRKLYVKDVEFPLKFQLTERLVKEPEGCLIEVTW
jgi:hypothetical protein